MQTNGDELDCCYKHQAKELPDIYPTLNPSPQARRDFKTVLLPILILRRDRAINP
jgi:hypothetical protein